MPNTHSLQLNGTDQYAYITDANQTGLGITGNLTMEAWIDPASLPSSGQNMQIVCKRGDSGASYQMFISNTGSDYILGFVCTSTGSDFASISKVIALSTGTCTHVATAYTASATGTVEFYQDGDSLGTANTNKASIYDSSEPCAIGGRYASTPLEFFDGKIDDVRIWNTVRSSAQILASYQKQIDGSTTNLQGYWRFNNDYTDETSNSNDLTAVGSPTFSTDVPFVGFTPQIIMS